MKPQLAKKKIDDLRQKLVVARKPGTEVQVLIECLIQLAVTAIDTLEEVISAENASIAWCERLEHMLKRRHSHGRCPTCGLGGGFCGHRQEKTPTPFKCPVCCGSGFVTRAWSSPFAGGLAGGSGGAETTGCVSCENGIVWG